MKQQEKPKTILNIFFNHGTRASIGLKLDPHNVKLAMELTERRVVFETTNQDETVESEEVVIDMRDVIFYSIQKPREITKSDIVTVPEGTLSRIHQ